MRFRIKCFPSIIILLLILTSSANARGPEQERWGRRPASILFGKAELTRFYSEKLLGQEQDTPPKQPQGLLSTESKQYFLWQEGEEQEFELWLSEEIEKIEEEEVEPIEREEKFYLIPYLEALRRWKHPITIDIDEIRKARMESLKPKEQGISLPLDSNLQISGYKSVRVEYNFTHYFGESDVSKYGYGGYSSGYSSGLDLGLTSSYYDSGYSSYGYSDYGYGGGYGGGYSSYGGYGGRLGAATGPKIDQELQINLHGRIGRHTHVAVDYSDVNTGGYMSSYGGGSEQKIKVWYEGDPDDIIQRVAFGDLTLTLPNTRFLSVNRNLFGLEAVAHLGGLRVSALDQEVKEYPKNGPFKVNPDALAAELASALPMLITLVNDIT